MTELYVSDFAWGYIAAGRTKDDTARRVAVARQYLWNQLNQVAAYADALIAGNAGLRQDGANLRQHVADLNVRRCLVRLQGG